MNSDLEDAKAEVKRWTDLLANSLEKNVGPRLLYERQLNTARITYDKVLDHATALAQAITPVSAAPVTSASPIG